MVINLGPYIKKYYTLFLSDDIAMSNALYPQENQYGTPHLITMVCVL